MTISPLIIHWLYDERYAEAGSMMAVSPSFFTLRYGVAHQAWLALGLTKYQAMDNIIRAVSVMGVAACAAGYWRSEICNLGVALHTFPANLC